MPDTNNRKSKPRFEPKSARLMDQVSEVLRYHHYALRTEESYIRWILAYIRFRGRKHPKDMGKEHIEAFLTHMAVNRSYAAATQNLARNAIVFLYKRVLGLEVAEDLVAARSKKPVRLESGTDIRVVQKLMGHADVKTTEIHTHALQLDIDRAVSPLEMLNGDAS